MKNSGAGIKRILVVEDEPVICEICIRVLTGEGFEVDIAANGEVAEDRLWERDYDLVIIDLKTPVMNGEELYRNIVNKHEEMVNRVVFTSGDTLGGDTQSFLEQADRPFLPKPFTPDELISIVRETLRQTDK